MRDSGLLPMKDAMAFDSNIKMIMKTYTIRTNSFALSPLFEILPHWERTFYVLSLLQVQLYFQPIIVVSFWFCTWAFRCWCRAFLIFFFEKSGIFWLVSQPLSKWWVFIFLLHDKHQYKKFIFFLWIICRGVLKISLKFCHFCWRWRWSGWRNWGLFQCWIVICSNVIFNSRSLTSIWRHFWPRRQEEK